jgi:hypothetical protein
MRTGRTALALAAGLALFIVATGCTPRVPDEDPSIRGTIVSVLPAEELGSIAVEAPEPPVFEYDRASIAITDKTTLLRETGDGDIEKISFGEFRLEQRVDVWFTGPVAESYPVQATAGTVLVRE